MLYHGNIYEVWSQSKVVSREVSVDFTWNEFWILILILMTPWSSGIDMGELGFWGTWKILLLTITRILPFVIMLLYIHIKV